MPFSVFGAYKLGVVNHHKQSKIWTSGKLYYSEYAQTQSLIFHFRVQTFTKNKTELWFLFLNWGLTRRQMQIHMCAPTHAHIRLLVGRSVGQLTSSNRLAVTALMDQHYSISPSISLALSLSHFLNQANTLVLWLFDIYMKISELLLEYLTVYAVSQLFTQSTSLCNQTATQWFQPAGLYSQPTNQPVILPVCLSASSSICLTVHLYLPDQSIK